MRTLIKYDIVITEWHEQCTYLQLLDTLSIHMIRYALLISRYTARTMTEYSVLLSFQTESDWKIDRNTILNNFFTVSIDIELEAFWHLINLYFFSIFLSSIHNRNFLLREILMKFNFAIYTEIFIFFFKYISISKNFSKDNNNVFLYFCYNSIFDLFAK